jgi:iron complex transport system substrate-binding protein
MKLNRKTTALLLAIVLSLALLTGCAQNNPADTSSPGASAAPPSASAPVTNEPSVSAPVSTEPSAAPTERTVTDMAGRTVTLPVEIKTIGTFGSIGVLNDFIETMGAGDKLCNEGSPSFVKASNWAKYQYKFTPQIKGMKPFQGADSELLMENILAVKPDLCLTMDKAMTEALEEQGLNVIQLAWQKTDDVKVCINLLGEILNAQDVAADYLKYFDDMIAKAEGLVKGLNEEDKKTVAYGTISTFSQPHIIAEWWLAEAGAVSVTADAFAAAGGEKLTYTLEDVLKWNPEIMLVMTAAEKDAILADSQLAEITAVKNGELYIVPRVAHVWGNRTTEQPLTIMWTINKLYPELVTNAMLTEDISYFYSHFFKTDLTDAEIQEIIG